VRLGSYIALELAVGALVLGGTVAGTLAVIAAVAPPSPRAEVSAATLRPPTPNTPREPAPPMPAPSQPSAKVDSDGAAAVPSEAIATSAGAAAAAAARVAPAPAPATLGATALPQAPGTAPPSDGALAMATEAAGHVGTSPTSEAPGPLKVASSQRATAYGASDEQLLAPLRGSAVVGCKANRGGTSLSLRLDFASGGRAAFKPEQIFPQSQPRREIAAYVVDRMLGIGHVPPATAIAVPMDQLVDSIAPAIRGALTARLQAEARPRRGVLRGVASWWIPEIKVAMIGKLPIDSTDGIVTWKRYLAAGATRPPEIAEFVAQISDMVLFDFLIDNTDRWSGGNARTSPDGRILYFMDNTLSFTRNKEAHERTGTYLRRVQVFSRRLVDKVRSFTRDDLMAALSAMDDGGMGPLLTEVEIDAVMERRTLAVRYLDELLAAHGADQVLAFP
jgi:hypothetical protein